MVVIAIPRHAVIAKLGHENMMFQVVCIWPYNSFFTNTLDVLPLEEPEVAIAELQLRLNGLADIVQWYWIEPADQQVALLRIILSEHANASIP